MDDVHRNSTLNRSEDNNDVSSHGETTGEMSIDGSLIEKESPPRDFITQRKGANSEGQDIRAELKCIVSSMDTWFAKQDVNFSNLVHEFNEVKTSLNFMNSNFEELKSKTEDVSRRVTTLETETKIINENSARITSLEARLDMMEQQARQCNIEISNLPEKRGENLANILQDLAAIVKQPITKQDVISIHRVPQASTATQRPKNVIVKFSSRLLRDSFIVGVRINKGITSQQLGIAGPSHKVYVNEHLTLKNKHLYRLAREAAKQHGFRFVWVKHGTILVRRDETSPVFAVRVEKDLSKINSQNK